MKERIIIIVGQTGTGKSGLAINLAQKHNGEIINADSMQIYKYLNIGTNKVSESDRKVPHHLLDIIEPNEDYDAYKFVIAAEEKIDQISAKSKVPFLVGGTGLYIRCFLGGIFQLEADTDEIREDLNIRLKESGVRPLYEELKKVDPRAAVKIKPNDIQRIIRALEVFKATGTTISDFQSSHNFSKDKYDYLKIGLKLEKEALQKRLIERTKRIYDDGLIQEVETLLNKGYKGELKALKSIGYKEAVDFIEGDISKEKAVEITYKRTKDYAKRQLTWFKKEKDIVWFDPENQRGDIETSIESFLNPGAK